MAAAPDAGWQQTLRRAWTRRGTLAWLLWPLSVLLGLLARGRRALYRWGLLRVERVPAPVIVVGNVVAGGSGKTPVVMALVQHLQARGLRPGVVSRGFGRSTADCREVHPDSLPSQVGDEPALLARRCAVPVFVARRRADAARALLARYPDTRVILCDDGLQHLALHRDIEVCVFNDDGAGNGFLLPAGPLREPWPRGATDLVLYPEGARPALAAGTQAFALRRALADEALRADGSRVALAGLRGQPLQAVAAIARPEAFFAMLRARGLTLAGTEALPDHDDFDSWHRPPGNDFPLICTEKDAVKLWRTHPDALAVPLALALAPGFFDAFDARLDARLSSPGMSSREP
jgi:tetraacyldisaccharide 4'-kinase